MTLLRTRFRIGGLFRPQATVRRAYDLFATPLPSSRIRAVQASASGHGAAESEFGHGGERIRTYAWGDPQRQPYVLLAHGWSSHGTRFAGWARRLQDAGYAAVAFDQPAHGHSSGRRGNLPVFADTLLAVGERFGPAAALVGHSLGGAAAALALARGLAARRAVLIAPAADPVDASFRFARHVGLPAHLCRQMLALFERRTGVALRDLQAQHAVPGIGRPALIVHDLEDREVPWGEGERYARFWTQARLLTTRGLGHNRILDDEAVIVASLRFLAGQDVGARIVSSPDLPRGFA
ncbi:alpha/beta fold hydrolase [Luteimonas sp. BDR2-5]|uniref:alpha/beta hydrolase n=1 Tax=Proluteimonas luteida TaxID=2878685 RepID=UPI001E30A678|nr:alpha/beta hydrolase [Luteimonas sp. BDR2-5]MCD9026966.1 alpha/beta fold hydrolase [Luteimonas sp. BDR2-5]